MINLKLYPILLDNRKSLRETSKDDSDPNDIQYMTSSETEVVNFDSHRPNISSVISGYKQPSKSAQSIEITGFIEKSKPPEIIFFYTLLPLTA